MDPKAAEAAKAQESRKADAIVEVLRRASTLVIVPPDGDHIAVAQALVNEKCPDAKARVVAKCYEMRLKPDEFVLVLSKWNEGEKKFTALSQPIDVGKHWDPEKHDGAGGIVTASFFDELSLAARPLCVKRRTEDNQTFTLAWA